MKYICLGYYDEKDWANKTEGEINGMMDECFAYDDVLRKGGHFAGGEALSSHRNATTLRYKDGKVGMTDGPYAETKEQIGGILILEAKDMDEAIRLMSKHPGVKNGPFDIRPVEDLTPAIQASEKWRAAKRLAPLSPLSLSPSTLPHFTSINALSGRTVTRTSKRSQGLSSKGNVGF